MPELGVAQLGRPLRVVQVIKSLNVGGATVQTLTLTKLLQEAGCETQLWRGLEEATEGNMDDLAERLGLQPSHIPSMRRNVGRADARALATLTRQLRRVQPDIVHTHGAKAGVLGRLGAMSAFPRTRGPILVHTFHGHSLRGYFSPRRDRLHTGIERFLARRTDRLVAVSEEVRDQLVALQVAAPGKFEVVQVGFDLSEYAVDEETRRSERDALRAALGLPTDAFVVTILARLVPIKRVDRFLRVARSLIDEADVRFLVVGDGELREELRSSEAARALGDRIVWTGFRRDIPAVCFASEVMALTSDNEGTPVSLIEAHAAGLPVVSTRVGGAAAVIQEGRSGFCIPVDEEDEMAAAIRRLVHDRSRAKQLGDAGRAHVTATFSRERLIGDIGRLYCRLLSERREGENLR